jgi:serine/threonine protein kinase
VDFQAGTQPIPGYRLTRPIGCGSFGRVWEAAHDGQLVALKFIDTRMQPASVISREVRVLRALDELRHPNIIRFLGVHASGQYMILEMERAKGNLADLREVYRRRAGGDIPADHALDLLDQAAVALDFLAGVRLPGLSSAGGLQHCDVKLANLLLLGDTLKVADFGLCSGAGCRTHREGWKGTLPYAAPELFHGSAAPGTDQYALAVTYCQMVMGEKRFFPASANAEPPPGPPLDLTGLPDREVSVLARALHRYPGSRWPSCAAFLQALRRAIAAPPVAGAVRKKPPSSGERRRLCRT